MNQNERKIQGSERKLALNVKYKLVFSRASFWLGGVDDKKEKYRLFIWIQQFQQFCISLVSFYLCPELFNSLGEQDSWSLQY